MAVPSGKAELLAAIALSFDRLMGDLARLPPERARLAEMPGHVAGTTMSPADLVAYLIGWNALVLEWLARDDAGLAVEFPAHGYRWNQLGALAQHFYAEYRDLDWPTLLVRLREVAAALQATVAARSDAELYGRAWYGKWTKGRMIQFNSAAPYANARGRIRKYLRSLG